ncbi:MAG: hypothetical protein IPF56_10925 [Chloroflexi bacterium]|nr:hypothetical protein [Chloroflexota bacterium]
MSVYLANHFHSAPGPALRTTSRASTPAACGTWPDAGRHIAIPAQVAGKRRCACRAGADSATALLGSGPPPQLTKPSATLFLIGRGDGRRHKGKIVAA